MHQPAFPSSHRTHISSGNRHSIGRRIAHPPRCPNLPDKYPNSALLSSTRPEYYSTQFPKPPTPPRFPYTRKSSQCIPVAGQPAPFLKRPPPTSLVVHFGPSSYSKLHSRTARDSSVSLKSLLVQSSPISNKGLRTVRKDLRFKHGLSVSEGYAFPKYHLQPMSDKASDRMRWARR
ncbi:hypothetical protein DFP72DRAFT_1043528 [Ephemerocybe angulata]|uniref:Uncharacterized protein n=1 Tax=Ephemerocybe angulata TaxID=980116 RepID=A0A8H6M8P2_9AGAR|nr:hypothetical protein DFP72DRAFT_1043528 [Tulosesus angulatus]